MRFGSGSRGITPAAPKREYGIPYSTLWRCA
ncbi:hypothetical protein JQ621_08335 [Bradyrhizobium manausense]|nr:hypothetical protein [Bradyrhizobium manausense]